ncbi:hypothetical protein Tco_1551175, partial [Tanacetum coccineum]
MPLFPLKTLVSLANATCGSTQEMKPKEPTYQVALDALTLTTCYPAFLIIAEVPVIYMHLFWATVIKHKSSYQFKIDKKRFSVNVEVLREILSICPKAPGKEFDELPTKEEALSFICELGHSGEISDDGKDDDDANDDDNQEGDDMNDDDEETDSDRTESDRIKIPVLNQSTTDYYEEEEEEKIDDEETMDEEDDEVTKELYD